MRRQTNPHNNKYYYEMWQSLRKTRDNLIYYPVFFLLPMLLIYSYPKQFSEDSTYLLLILGIILIIIYIYLVFSTLLLSSERSKKVIKGASLYIIETAFIEIENDDKIRVPFLLSQLFYSGYDYLEQITFKLGKDNYSQKGILGFNLSSIRKIYLLKYLQSVYNKYDSKKTLKDISSDLNSTQPVQYEALQSFVISTFKGVENYSALKRGQELEIRLKIFGVLVEIVLVAFTLVGALHK